MEQTLRCCLKAKDIIVNDMKVFDNLGFQLKLWYDLQKLLKIIHTNIRCNICHKLINKSKIIDENLCILCGTELKSMEKQREINSNLELYVYQTALNLQKPLTNNYKYLCRDVQKLPYYSVIRKKKDFNELNTYINEALSTFFPETQHQIQNYRVKLRNVSIKKVC